MKVIIEENQRGFLFKDGKYIKMLNSGKHRFWNKGYKVSIVNLDDELVLDNIIHKINVEPYEKARLYLDNKFVRLLDEGTHYFINNGTKIISEFVDTRLLQMHISGQELLSLDKVTLRINFFCEYKIIDYIKIDTEIEDYESQLHITMQLALRNYISKYRLDEILENKEEISNLMLKELREKQGDYYIEIYEAGIKDIILPGEIRDIINTVLIAEKRAQANVITRREEVASTRSLLNTAKLMDENQTLYKLKELEYMEKICDNVGNITLAGGNGILTELSKIMKGA